MSKKKGKLKFTAVIEDPPWTPFQPADLTPADWARVVDVPTAIWVNSRYHVFVYERETPLGLITHLSIKRNDQRLPKDWRDFQRIKNELCGPEREAVELYPAEERLVDTSNQYHLWVLPPGMFFPFGFMERLVTEDGSMGTKQRAFADKPADLATQEELNQKFVEERKRLEAEGRVPKDLLPHMALAVKKTGT